MEAKFKIGDRVVVSMDCDDDLSGRDPVQFRGRAGVVAGVFHYNGEVPMETDYDVIIDGDDHRTAKSCPAFAESHLTLEAV